MLQILSPGGVLASFAVHVVEEEEPRPACAGHLSRREHGAVPGADLLWSVPDEQELRRLLPLGHALCQLDLPRDLAIYLVGTLECNLPLTRLCGQVPQSVVGGRVEDASIVTSGA